MNGLRRNDAEAPDRAGIQQPPQVTVVILNWNGKEYLGKFLPFVLASSYPNKRVIVADNASTDGSVLFLQQSFPNVEILIHPENEGFAKGYNSALRQVETDYFVLLNSDVEVAPDWIEPAINLMESDLSIAACQPKILSFNDRSRFEYAGACGGWLDMLGYPFARGRVFDHLETDQGQYNGAAACFWASGAAMFVRASVYKELGGLDEYFFAHQEEIDFCWRAQLAGFRVFVQPQSVVYHVGGGTLSKGAKLKTFLNFRNNLVMLAKNLPVTRAIWTIPARIFLDMVSALKELMGGNGGYFIAVFRAHVHFLKWLLRSRRNRPRTVSPNRQLNGWYSSSLVWQHFIKKKNLFSEIVRDK